MGVMTAAEKITNKIEELGDWRGETLARVRRLIHDADPEIEEEWKWEKPSSGGAPVLGDGGGGLYRGVLQAGREAHVLPRRLTRGPQEAVQLQSRGEDATCHRHPRRRAARR